MNLFDKIYVSTDSQKVKLLCKKFRKNNVYVPFLRPKIYSGDHVGTRDVILHSIRKLEFNKNDNIFCIYPTSVFVRKKMLENAISILNKRKKIFIFSAKKIEKNIFRGFFLRNEKIVPIFRGNTFKRSQDMKTAYVDAAQFYLAKSSTWLKNKNIFNKNSKFIEINRNLSQDIDYQSDWIFAENLYKNLNNKKYE